MLLLLLYLACFPQLCVEKLYFIFSCILLELIKIPPLSTDFADHAPENGASAEIDTTRRYSAACASDALSWSRF